MKSNKQRRGIGFTNFRRFEEFPLLSFSPITYMVGKNNSGKSTMVKALLLVLDYLQNQLSDTFSFESNILEDVNIVTFGRAKNNRNISPTITFQFQLEEFEFHLEISGDEENTEAQVAVLRIQDTMSGITIEINRIKGEVILFREVVDVVDEVSHENTVVDQLEKAVTDLKKDLDKIKDKKSAKAFRLQSDHQRALDKLKEAKKIKKEVKPPTSSSYHVRYGLDIIYAEGNRNDDNPLAFIIDRVLYLNEISSKKNKKEVQNLADVVALNRNTSQLNERVNRIIETIENEQYFYLGANPSKQSALFYLRDKKNALAQAVHNFYQLGITTQISDSEELRFVQKWMRKFEVGYDLNVKFIAGEAYRVKIYKSEEDQKKDISSHLADKGMGSLQVMTLILRIASIIREKKKGRNKNKVFTILIEEPELNLHPNLQSQLTIMFHEVSLEFGFNFLVETHSEYMIRKSQVIVNKQKYSDGSGLDVNPFKVYYFPVNKSDPPYQMKYREDGKFSNEFRPGFFDISSDLAFDIL